jgi:hypothetical protein
MIFRTSEIICHVGKAKEHSAGKCMKSEVIAGLVDM